MSSRSYDLGSTQYGSINVNKASNDPPNRNSDINANAATAKSTPSSSIPPKPAVRHRKSISSAHPPSALKSSDDIKQPTSSENRLELNHEPVELIDSKAIESAVLTQGKTTSSCLPLPIGPPGRDEQPIERSYPKKVLFIVANEFCERFSYYGLRTVLVLYFKSVIGFSDNTSTVSFHLFATLCYLTPILGAILGDSVWGKFKTIFYLSILYFFGELVLVLSSIFWDAGAISTIATFSGLILIGIGTGGIKPCVSTLGGDQFLPHEEKWRQTFFSVFYGAINLGSLISMFLTPLLRSKYQCVERSDCYPLAFGLPCILMFLSIVVFLLAKNSYVIVPLPERNIIVAFCQCIGVALKRKLTGCGWPHTNPYKNPIANSSSSSVLSTSSDEAACLKNKSPGYSLKTAEPTAKIIADSECSRIDQSGHWLYLASDQFDRKSIEEFRQVLSVFLLFIPLPVYWCLFDQQSSLWTLQASRMDGRIPNTNWTIQPDQMSVANPIILLMFIPVFEFAIYPALDKCGILRKSVQRMTFGGLLAGVTFILSALIEMQIQQNLPALVPPNGNAHLVIVNGLNGCSMIDPSITYSYLLKPSSSHQSVDGMTNPQAIDILATLNGTKLASHGFEQLKPVNLSSIPPLGHYQVALNSANSSSLDNYRLSFKLSSDRITSNNHTNSSLVTNGCPLDSGVSYDLTINPFEDQSVYLLYVEQGNGKLTYKLFDESLQLPPSGKARVRLVYEFFGSSSIAAKRRFSLVTQSMKGTSQRFGNQNMAVFRGLHQKGQVMISDYLDLEVPPTGGIFELVTSDNSIKMSSVNDSSATNMGPQQSHNQTPKPSQIYLKPGTRNLITVHQLDAGQFQVQQQTLQDNNYRISMLYQLGPYLLISISEVMFGITGLELSYSMAPETMKAVIMAGWCLTIAFGNILTVAVESLHIFADVTHDFLFYASFMIVDMAIFAILAYKYKPNEWTNSQMAETVYSPKDREALE